VASQKKKQLPSVEKRIKKSNHALAIVASLPIGYSSYYKKRSFAQRQVPITHNQPLVADITDDTVKKSPKQM
jgi:hypothetical protein